METALIESIRNQRSQRMALLSSAGGDLTAPMRGVSILRLPMIERTANVLFLSFFLSFFFWPHRVACGILVPWPGIEPASPAWEARSLNHWTTREVPKYILLLLFFGDVLFPPSSSCRMNEHLMWIQKIWNFTIHLTLSNFLHVSWVKWAMQLPY